MKTKHLLSLALLSGAPLYAQGVPKVTVTPVSENILHVQVTPEGVSPSPTKVSALEKPLEPFTGKCRISAKTGADGSISFTDSAGNVILSQKTQSFGSSKVGTAEFRSVSVNWESGKDDGLYGLGTFQDGHMDIRGHELACYQKNLEDTVPMVVSTGGFGIFWDNAAPFTFKAQKGRDFSIESPTGGEVDYYLIAGNPNTAIAGYRQLTGVAPMFPKWVFGYHQSKERYQNQNEVLAIAKEFRERKFPLDLIIQDWQYWGDHGWNASKFDTARFPDAKTMIEKLHADNIKYITSVWPSFTEGPKGSDVYKELLGMGVLSPIHPHFYDAFSPAAREVVWKHAKKGLYDLGVDGWWLDASEPELGGTNWHGGHQTVDNVFSWGATTKAGPFPSLANAYPLYVVKAFHDGQLADTSPNAGKRFFTLTRSVYAGSQRWGVNYWTGDTQSNWTYYRWQIPACLNMAAAGIPYENADIGGFANGPDPKQPDMLELAVRWFQFGAFTGQFRMHGTGLPREPWRYGEPGSVAYDTMLAFTNLRYQLLPYIYSTSWQITSANASLMRPLAMDFPDDAAVRDIPDEFIFGPSLLVAPITDSSSGSSTVIPSESLLDESGKPGGLDATYYTGTNFQKEAVKRKDAEIRFAWEKKPRTGMGADPSLDPIPELGDMDHWSARWKGFLKTDAAGKYNFSLSGNDGFRLKLDGKEVASDWRARPEVTQAFSVELPADAKIPVELEFFQDTSEATLAWKWSKPSQDRDVATRQVTFPAGADWYDFWTGEKTAGGQAKTVRSPLTTMPLYVRAGSILPFGPVLQHTGEKSDKPTELRIYPGTDAAFTLYDDAGDGYGYKKGEHSIIELKWNDKTKTLSLGKRIGTFPGMSESQSFTARLLQPDGTWKDIPVQYTGTAKEAKF